MSPNELSVGTRLAHAREARTVPCGPHDCRGLVARSTTPIDDGGQDERCLIFPEPEGNASDFPPERGHHPRPLPYPVSVTAPPWPRGRAHPRALEDLPGLDAPAHEPLGKTHVRVGRPRCTLQFHEGHVHVFAVGMDPREETRVAGLASERRGVTFADLSGLPGFS